MPLLPAPPSRSPAPAGGYAGEVADVFAYDIAYQMPRQVTGTLLGQPVGHFDFDAQNHHAPRKPLFCRPDMTRLPAQTYHGQQEPVQVRRTVTPYQVGAISIALHVPISVQRVQDLSCYHDWHLAKGYRKIAGLLHLEDW